ncbi:hypothetical protein LCGC14_0457110 [marine sediment metagenome]|uniref:Uncharacterized protein n=1 Tax=marine sediment metagenome TaxID=412755 RepID=A0A0F9SLL4_9ZZZZ|nr:hypothetical protein [Candidatus Aminicenantes bacterium]
MDWYDALSSLGSKSFFGKMPQTLGEMLWNDPKQQLPQKNGIYLVKWRDDHVQLASFRNVTIPVWITGRYETLRRGRTRCQDYRTRCQGVRPKIIGWMEMPLVEEVAHALFFLMEKYEKLINKEAGGK